MAEYLLAIDVGTSTLHCLVTDRNANPIATAEAPVRYFTSEGSSELSKEFAPNRVFRQIGALVAKTLAAPGLRGSDLRSIGITGQRQGLVFLDQKGNEVLASPNIDLRAVFEGAEIDEERGQEVYRTTGHLPSLLLAPARLRWLRQTRPGVFNRLWRLLTVPGWLTYRLTGETACEPSLACEAGLVDVRTRLRCQPLLSSLGLSSTLLPPMGQAGSIVGCLTPKTAEDWGLQPGTPVTIAGPDTQCGLLGMGLATAGQGGAVLGWSGALQMLTSGPCYDEAMRTWVGCFPANNLWVSESNLGDAGNAYRWLKDILFGTSATFDRLERLVAAAPPGNGAVLSFLGPGPTSMNNAGLKLGGLLLTTPMSFHEVTKGQLPRAYLENLSYSIKANWITLRELTGLHPKILHLGGGMARSRTLAAVLANVLGTEVRRSTIPQVSARGAAMAAAVAGGFYPSLEEAAQEAQPMLECFEPDPALALEYQGYYQDWCRLYQNLQDCSRRLDE